MLRHQKASGTTRHVRYSHWTNTRDAQRVRACRQRMQSALVIHGHGTEALTWLHHGMETCDEATGGTTRRRAGPRYRQCGGPMSDSDGLCHRSFRSGDRNNGPCVLCHIPYPAGRVLDAAGAAHKRRHDGGQGIDLKECVLLTHVVHPCRMNASVHVEPPSHRCPASSGYVAVIALRGYKLPSPTHGTVCTDGRMGAILDAVTVPLSGHIGYPSTIGGKRR